MRSAMVTRIENSLCPIRAEAVAGVAADGILVAWDGSPTVISALQALLSEALSGSKVILAEVERRCRPSVEDAAAWLSAHGMNASVERLCQRGEAACALEAACRSHRPRRCVVNRESMAAGGGVPACAFGSLA